MVFSFSAFKDIVDINNCSEYGQSFNEIPKVSLRYDSVIGFESLGIPLSSSCSTVFCFCCFSVSPSSCIVDFNGDFDLDLDPDLCKSWASLLSEVDPSSDGSNDFCLLWDLRNLENPLIPDDEAPVMLEADDEDVGFLVGLDSVVSVSLPADVFDVCVDGDVADSLDFLPSLGLDLGFVPD